MKKCFLSYTLNDNKINESILINIEKYLNNYCDIYIDLLHNDSELVQKRVESELLDSDLFILVVTEGTYKSKWVRREIELAKLNNIDIAEVSYIEIINNNYSTIMDVLHRKTGSGGVK